MSPTLADWQRQNRWAGCVSFAYLYPNGEFPEEWIGLAREMMRRARTNVEALVARLQASGYRFANPDQVHVGPDADLAEQLNRFERLGFHVPLSLRTWWEEVGTVNLMGTHPDWPHSGYAFDSANVWDSDPLVVDLPNLIEEYENWNCSRAELGADYLRYIGPFRIPIAPDAILKANYSGGSPYAMACDAPGVDSLVFNEMSCLPFVSYLRMCFDWAGFPGLRCYEDAPLSFIAELKKDLIPL
jgi:hypothetical protein